jgi:hypothetical protein
MHRLHICALGAALAATFASAGRAAQTVSYQSGVNGYYSSVDDHISYGIPDNANTDGPILWVDGITTYDNQGGQSLLRFENIIGNGTGQIPAHSTVTSAVLTLYTGSAVDSSAPGAGGTLNRMVQNWTNTYTWNSFGGDGIQANGVEAASTSNASIGGPYSTVGGTINVNVVTDVQAWVDGTPNYGWALLPWPTGGTNGWAFYSDSYADASMHEMLTVTFIPAPEPMTGSILLMGMIGLTYRRPRKRQAS